MNLLGQVLLVDGITRGGKSLVGLLLRSINKIEKVEQLYSIEHIISGIHMGKIEPDFSLKFFRSAINERIYDGLIARNVNFRPGETTSTNWPEFRQEFVDRLHFSDGDSVLRRLENESRVFPFITHEAFLEKDYILNNFEEITILEVVRDPFEVYFSWVRKNWGERFGNDPRAWRITFRNEINNSPIPWVLHKNANAWLDSNPNNNIANAVSFLTRYQINKIFEVEKAYNKKLITINYQDFISDPLPTLLQISRNFNFELREEFDSILSSHNVPRRTSISDNDKKNEAKAQLSKESYNMLLESHELYKKNFS